MFTDSCMDYGLDEEARRSASDPRKRHYVCMVKHDVDRYRAEEYVFGNIKPIRLRSVSMTSGRIPKASRRTGILDTNNRHCLKMRLRHRAGCGGGGLAFRQLAAALGRHFHYKRDPVPPTEPSSRSARLMQPSGASDGGGVVNEEQPDGTLGTTDLWYNASCYECTSRHRIATEAEEKRAQQEVQDYPTRSNSTASQHNYFCDILRCRTMKYDKHNRQEQAGRTDRGQRNAPMSTGIDPTVAPFSPDGIAQDFHTELNVGMESQRFDADTSEQHPVTDLRRAPKPKGSVHGLRNRLKKSISNMTLRPAPRDNTQEDTGRDPRSRLKSSASKLNLRTAFRGQQNPTGAVGGDAPGLRTTFSNMSLRRAFQRKEPEFVMLVREGAAEEEAPTPESRKRMGMRENLPVGGLGLRQAVSSMSLRSSSTMDVMSEGELELPQEPLPSLVRRRVAIPGNPSARGLRQSVSSIALRTVIISPEIERDDLGPMPNSARRKRLAIAGQLPPRGQVQMPPGLENPKNSKDGNQPTVKPQLRIQTQGLEHLEDAEDMYVATALHPLRHSSTLLRHHGSMDTLGETISTQPKPKFCDPDTLAILTGASKAPNDLDYRPDWSDPFLQGYLAERDAGGYKDEGDDGYRRPAKSPPKPSPASSTLGRDDVSVLRDSERFANFDSGTRSVSPLTVPLEESSDRNSGSTVQQDLRRDELQRMKSSSNLQLTPRSEVRAEDDSIQGVKDRLSLESFGCSWAGSNASEFFTFLDAAEHGEL